MKKTSKRIRVRGSPWKIIFKKEVLWQGVRCLGLCIPMKKTIWIDSGLNKAETAETIIHEYLHALWHELGLEDENLPGATEHWLICGISKDIMLNSSFFRSLL